MAFDFSTVKKGGGFDFATASPSEMDTTRESAIGATAPEPVASVQDRINQEKSKVVTELGGAVDFEKSYASNTMRADLGLSNSEEEARAKIRNYKGFENANVRRVGDDIYIQKGGKGDVWTPVNVAGIDQGDLAEISTKYGPQIAGSLAAVGAGPAGIVGNIIRSFVGGAVGFTAGQAVEQARGTQLDPLSTVGLQSLQAGTEEALGQGFGEVVGRFVSSLSGRGAVKLDREQQEVVQSLRDAGATPTPGAVARSPIAKQTEDFYSRLSTSASNRLKENAEKISEYRNVLKNRLGTPESLEAGRILREEHAPRILKNIKESYDSAVRDYFGGETAKGLRASGRGIKEGLESFRARVAEVKDTLYTSLREQANELGEDMAVDVTNLQRGVKGLSDEILAKVKGGKEKDIALKPEDRQLIDLLGTVSVLEKEQPFEVVDRLIKNVNSIIRKDGISPNDKRIAISVKELLNKSLDGDILVTNPELKKLYTRARNYAKGRAKVLENDYIRHISKSWEPAKLVQELARPGELDTLLLARKSMGKQKWEDFRTQVRSDLLDNPDKILKNMDRYHPDERKILFNRNDAIMLRKYGENIRDLNNSPLQQILTSRLDSGKVVLRELLSDNSERAITLLNQLDKKALDEVRPGIVAEILDRSTKIVNGKIAPDLQKFGKIMLNLEKKGLGKRLLNSDQMKLLKRWASAAGAQPPGGASGLASIGRISAALEMKDKAIGKLIYTGILGHLVTSKGTSLMLYGTGKRQPINEVANIVRITNTLKQDFQKDAEKRSEIPSRSIFSGIDLF